MNSLLHKNSFASMPVMPIGKSKHLVQPKLTINTPGDQYEQEADAMADKVMRMPANDTVKPVTGLIGTSLQRKCSHCEEEERKRKPVMRKTEAGNAGMSVSPSFVSSLNASKGGGSSLPEGTKSFMENAFSTDFFGVRVHTDGKASEMNKGINAKAFTYGNDIYFNHDAFSPYNNNGKKLLAHELTHVVQQESISKNSGSINTVQRRTDKAAKPELSVNQSAYINLMKESLKRMSGTFVGTETLSGVVEPILTKMVDNAAWKDAAGVEHGGKAINYKLPTGVTIKLKLILNDSADPVDGGEFRPDGDKEGEMQVSVRVNDDIEVLTETLYHESMHMISWLINRRKPALKSASSGTTQGVTGALQTLDESHSKAALDSIKMWLTVLKETVNKKRGTGSKISDSQVNIIASWLLEEILVRVETEAFRRAFKTQQYIDDPKVELSEANLKRNKVDRHMVEEYIFTFSKVFLSSDLAGLDELEKHPVDMLQKIFYGIFHGRSIRRFSTIPYKYTIHMKGDEIHK